MLAKKSYLNEQYLYPLLENITCIGEQIMFYESGTWKFRTFVPVDGTMSSFVVIMANRSDVQKHFEPVDNSADVTTRHPKCFEHR